MSTAASDSVQNLSVMQPPLLDRMISDKEFAKEIMNTFLKDVNSRKIIIKAALGNRDTFTVRAQAHTIKSSSSCIGATTLEEVAYQIEIAGESGDLGKAGSLVPKINEYIEILKKHWLNYDMKKLVSFYDNFNSRR